jgi:hypothetical protein
MYLISYLRKYSQFVLDVYYDAQTSIVYLMREDAMAAVIYLNDGKAIKNSRLFRINGLTPTTRL